MHKYAKEMMAMAEAAKSSDKPWKVLQVKNANGEWQECDEDDLYLLMTAQIWGCRIKLKEKKKLWLWHKVEIHRVVMFMYGTEDDESFPERDGWHKTNIFIEVEG